MIEEQALLDAAGPRCGYKAPGESHRKLMRARAGNALTLTTALLFALLLIGIGYLGFLMYMGGSSETENACDAGALNMGKKASSDITVTIGGAKNERCFLDVDDDGGTNPIAGQVSLRSINRVWAKALLIAINAAAAQLDGNCGSGQSSANSAHSGAKAISDRLSSKLSDASNLQGFFNQMAAQNSVRMLGLGAKISAKPGSGWRTSFMDRDKESNVVLTGRSGNFNLPPGYNLNSSYITDCTRTPTPAGADQYKFLKGYTPLEVGGNTFWQVPFLYDEKPHLVSGQTFSRDQSLSKLAWSQAVPNAFSCDGVAQKSGAPGQTARSFVLANPRQEFKISMPHSFMHIKLDEMKAKYYFYPTGTPPVGRVEYGTEQTYGYTVAEGSGSAMPGGGLLCSYVTPGPAPLGLDVVGRTLDDVIFGPPPGNSSKVEGYMVNRVNEMISKPGKILSASDLHSALSNPATIGFMISGQRDFYLFSPNGESLSVQPEALALAEAPWLATMVGQNADGSETKIIDNAQMPAPIFTTPTVVPDPACVLVVALGWGSWHKNVYWQPGTGYNGNLGQIRVTRWTEVDSLGICAPAP